MQKNSFHDTVYFKAIAYNSGAGIVHLGIDTVSGSPTFGKLVRKTAGGATPTLQQVTDAGQETLDFIGAETFRVWPIFSGARYTSNWVGILGYAGNGASAQGNLTLREFSDGSGNTVTVSPLDIASDIEFFLPHETTGDTLAVRSLVRKGFPQGADVASAVGAISLSDDATVFEITGTNAITLINNVNWHNGSEITLIFTSTASLTDGTANSGNNIGFELAANANFTASADDTITLILCEIGGTQRWREKCRSVN